MTAQLTFKLLPRNQRGHEYDWMNIDHDGVRVGKVRGLINGKLLTIHSINIFPEFEHRGFGRETIKMFKRSFDTIVADRVRHTAIGFWQRMGFRPDGHGNYVWKRRRRAISGMSCAMLSYENTPFR